LLPTHPSGLSPASGSFPFEEIILRVVLRRT
jgi:hypothetical protein